MKSHYHFLQMPFNEWFANFFLYCLMLKTRVSIFWFIHQEMSLGVVIFESRIISFSWFSLPLQSTFCVFLIFVFTLWIKKGNWMKHTFENGSCELTRKWCSHYYILITLTFLCASCLIYFGILTNPWSSNLTKWSNTLKNLSAIADELFECVWPFCGVGA